MSDGARQFRALLKMRAVARRSLASAAQSLAGLERAKADVRQSLDRLDAAIRTEEAVALGRADVGFRDFAAYLSGAASKRTALIQSGRTLDAEIATMCAAVLEAEIELKKLDYLTDQFEARIRKSLRKREAVALDDAGRRSHSLRRTAG